ncbi:MAG: hypothetical protein N2747_06660 [Chitinophagaceae bacterium]|nr:hypothetical protein [Chitinophagaceae bacterium]
MFSQMAHIPAFLLMLSGAMAFGSMYSMYLNNPKIKRSAVNITLTLLMCLFVFCGFYSYQLITFGKGSRLIAFTFNALLFVLTAFSFLKGYDKENQRWFSLHEILNLLLTFILTLYFGQTLL